MNKFGTHEWLNRALAFTKMPTPNQHPLNTLDDVACNLPSEKPRAQILKIARKLIL